MTPGCGSARRTRTTISPTIDFGTGPVKGSFFLVQLDASGTAQWARGFGGRYGIADIAQTPCDGLVVAGSGWGYLNLNGEYVDTHQSEDAFVAGFDAQAGALRWARVVGDYEQQPAMQAVRAVSVDTQGNAYAAGLFSGSMHWRDHKLVANAGQAGQAGPDGFLVKLLP